MRRPWQIWLAFAACLALAVTTVGWMTLKALELDRAEVLARRMAVLEENARLALWRMDSQLTSLLALENSRPYFTYSATYPAGGPFGEQLKGGDVVFTSPLAQQTPPLVLLHFQFDPRGVISSPQVNQGRKGPGKGAGKAGGSQPRPEQLAAARRLAQVARLIDRSAILASLPVTEPEPLAVFNYPGSSNYAANSSNYSPQLAQQDSQQLQQQTRASNEYQARQSYVHVQNQIATNASELGPMSGSNARTSVMVPRWEQGELLLVRRVTLSGAAYLQGCLLDWPAIKGQLLAAIKDLLPQAELQAAPASPAVERARMMATLPVLLEPGDAAFDSPETLSPLKMSLLAAWVSLLVAAAAIAALLQGVVSLSERRASFVSAVTHELRTPLTTFRMYAEMLSEGMIGSEEQRKLYLHTLRTEAERLTHLVQNVLAYARLERGRPGGRIEPVKRRSFSKLAQERLSDRARQAELSLVVEADDSIREREVMADRSAVEQILFNLVDNACKYAAGAADRLLHLEAEAAGKQIVLRLRDHGPGVADTQRRVLFQPFRKSADEAARSAPGVGLGLALSRRLARDMRGDLTYCANGAGACFELRLPAVG